MNIEYDFSAATETAREKMRDAVAHGEECVRTRPAMSLLTAFAAGLAVGAVVVIATRSKSSEPALDESRERLADFLASVSGHLRNPLEKTRASLEEGAGNLAETLGATLARIRPAAKKLGWW